MCHTCYKSLNDSKIPRLSKCNGFKYPEFPSHLLPLDVITEHLVSPRLPFMQRRRLRRVYGSKSIIGQVVNIPVNVNNMVNALPRQLDDHRAFKVHIKRHQIHKTPYLAGAIKKADVKEWLQYLLTKPLYQNIKIDDTFFETHHDKETADDEIKESIPEAQKDDAHDMLLSKKHTMFWDDDMYLDLAPGMNEKPVSLLWGENAQELSFPSIYLGETRKCKGAVTLDMIASSEIRRRDRRVVKPEHVLYMEMKIMRIRLHEGLHLTFPNQGDAAKLKRNDVEEKTFIEKRVEYNFAFTKSIPNSPQYWLQKKKVLFDMMRQLGKPTFFLTLSASEYRLSQILRILYRLRYARITREAIRPSRCAPT